LPGVLFIHGGPVLPELSHIKDSGQYRSWGALVAASGLLGFTFNHRYHAAQQLEQSVADVRSAVDFIRKEAGSFGLDPERLCLRTFRGQLPAIIPAMANTSGSAGLYASYLLRLWRESSAGPDSPWQAQVESIQAGQSWHFATSEELLAFLERSFPPASHYSEE
jgi:hypothetical protein